MKRSLALLGVLAACDRPVEYDPYVGGAFPSPYPPLADPPGGIALVTDSLSDTISVIDLDTDQRVQVYPVGRDPVGVDGPHHVVVDLAGGLAYVPLSYPSTGVGPHGGHGTSTRIGWLQMLSLEDLEILGQVRVDLNPGDVAISDDGALVVVSHFDLAAMNEHPGDLDAARSSLVVVDGGSLLPSGSPEPRRVKVCLAAHGILALPPAGHRVALACYGEDAVAFVDLDAGVVEEIVPLGPGASPFSPEYGPYAMAASPDGAELAVSNTESDDVRFLDLATLEVDPARTVSFFGTPLFPRYSEDGSLLFVPTQVPDGVSVVDLASSSEIARRDFLPGECALPHELAWDGGDLLLACEGDHEAPGAILRLDAATLETKASVAVGVFPDKVLPLPHRGAP